MKSWPKCWLLKVKVWIEVAIEANPEGVFSWTRPQVSTQMGFTMGDGGDAIRPKKHKNKRKLRRAAGVGTY